MKSIIYVSFMLRGTLGGCNLDYEGTLITGNDECMNYIIVIKKTIGEVTLDDHEEKPLAIHF